MKFQKYLLILSLLSFISCKEYLETTPSDFLTPVNFYQNKTQLTLSLNGVYQVMSQSSCYGEIYQHAMTQSTDESILNYLNTSPSAGYYNVTAGNAEITNYWNNLYTGIDRANMLLENINVATDLSDLERQQIKAEAIFLRAYYYFLLTQWYGDVPLRLASTKSALGTDFPFTPSKEVYNFIIDEMTAAEAMLSQQKASSFNYTEKVTQTTVQGILARVCLYAAGNPINDTKRYAEALSWAQKVVSSGEHRLNPDYSQLFKLESADGYDNVNREVMWEVGFSWNPLNTARLTASQVRIGMPTSANSIGRVYGWTYVYPRLFKSYESVIYAAAPAGSQDLSPDLRREWNCPVFYWSGGSATAVPTATNYTYSNYWDRYPGKWRRQYETVIPRDNNNSPRNLPIIRYSDVLLMLAEADNEINGPTSLGIEAVNEVRSRGYGETLQGKSVVSIAVTNGGRNYTSAPTVTISGGTGATARATVSGGRVTAVNLTSLGANFTAEPVISFSGGGGTDAAARGTLSNAALAASKYADKDSFKKAIQDERLRELNGEFLRRQDLRRWGILVSTLKTMLREISEGSIDKNPNNSPVIPAAAANQRNKYSIPGNNISNKDLYLPIPQNELTYNRQAKQNPGY